MQISKFNGNKLTKIKIINQANLKILNVKPLKVTWIEPRIHRC